MSLVSEHTSGSAQEFGRTPPQDNVAEQSVLGGMMLSKDAIADVVEVLRGVDFYKPAHESIYEAVISLYGRGEPADAITVADELTKRGEIERIGGPAYLHTLISSVPTAANAGFYAEIVHERAVLRRLVEAGTKIVQLGYTADGEVDDIVNQAQAEIYQVAERRSSEDYTVLKEVIESTVDEIEAAGSRGEGMRGVPTGFLELDELTHGFQGGQMIVIAARPAMGKSTLALDVARSAAIKHDMTTVIFSLEMSRNEIAMRLLSAEATLNMQDLRKGHLQDEQWAKIATTMGKMDSAPLFIDDSPNMSLMEIRAKCRRLKQKHDLKLVVLDYLQLMSSGKKVESRQQEVSEFSRALKLLAKELDVPVIALSQLNRGSEQRSDKKPMISDLRESGCLTADTRVLRADTGAEVTMGELFESGARDVPVWSLGDDLRYVERTLTHVFSTGVKPVYRLTLASGKTVRATANHPFFTHRGWTPLGELTAGDRAGVPRHTPGPGVQTIRFDDDAVRPAATLAAGSSAEAGVWGDISRTLAAPVPLGDAVRESLTREAAGSVATLTRVTELLDGAGLDFEAVNDLLWDTVVSITYEGEEEVFDATVPGTHNFVANGIAVHNSIEQDADMVILLHREDMYDKEHARAGEADVIVAKHRNGPTKTIVVAFQGHYSRFANMAHEGL